MYINYNLLYSKELTLHDFHVLQMVFQKEYLMVEGRKEFLPKLIEREYVSYLKDVEKFENLRITKKGKALLDSLGTMGMSEEISETCESLLSLYEGYNKPTGNKLEVQTRLIWFVSQTGFSHEIIKKSVEEYLGVHTEYTKKLENLLWKPQSVFSTHKSLKDSHLYDIICKKYRLNTEFFLKKNKGVLINWLSSIAKLKPPRTSKDKDIYLTGSYKSDNALINKIRLIYLEHIKS